MRDYSSVVEKYKDLIDEYVKNHPEKTNAELGRIIAKDIDINPTYMSLIIGAHRGKFKKNTNKSKKEKVSHDSEKEDKFEERSLGETNRGSDGTITGYSYEIFIRDKAPLVGNFTREEMDTVYRLYSSNDGANLNQRSVSREFPNITFRDFKRILRAFKITKDAVPVAPHVIEENDSDKVTTIIRQNKENVVLKKLEEGKSKHYEKLWHKALNELITVKENRKVSQEFLKDLIDTENLDTSPIKIKVIENKDKIAINFYLADIHLGADTLKDSMYKNPWNEEEAQKCINSLLVEIMNTYKYYGRLEQVNLIHLGDGVDGKDGKTTRDSGHSLPQNLNNKEQTRAWVKLMKMTIDSVHELNVSNNIAFYTTTDDNHAGDFLYGAYLALEEFCLWKYPDMTYVMFEEFIGHFNCGIHTFPCTHGKDKIHMKSGMPICIDPKTENRINEYLDAHGLFHQNIHFIKADLHQSARQSVARFDYKNVFSAYGASAWIHTNFGIGQAGIDYDIIWMNENRILEGRIRFHRGSIYHQRELNIK